MASKKTIIALIYTFAFTSNLITEIVVTTLAGLINGAFV